MIHPRSYDEVMLEPQMSKASGGSQMPPGNSGVGGNNKEVSLPALPSTDNLSDDIAEFVDMGVGEIKELEANIEREEVTRQTLRHMIVRLNADNRECERYIESAKEVSTVRRPEVQVDTTA